MTKASKENEVVLEKILYIHYPFYFWKGITDVKTLINFSSKVNAMTPAYASKLGLQARQTNVRA